MKDLDFLSLVMIFFSSLEVNAGLTSRLFASLWFNEFSDTDLSLLSSYNTVPLLTSQLDSFRLEAKSDSESGISMGRDGT